MKKLQGMVVAAGLVLSAYASVYAARRGETANRQDVTREVSPLSQKAKAILQMHCASCHGGGKAAKGGFGFVLDRDLLVSRLLIAPGQARQSDLFLRIQQGEMPPASQKLRPSPDELKALEQWIDAGAPAFDRTLQVAKALSPFEATEAILADLKELEPRRRRFTRYLTLSHLGYAGRPGHELDAVREAAGKLLNSLSWHPRLSS